MPETTQARVQQIFGEALELPAERRPDFLQKACLGDLDLRTEVEALLAAHMKAADAFLKSPLTQTAFAEASGRGCDSVGTRIGRYKLLQHIGEGGMGAVYLAEQEQPIRRRVALKIIKLGMDTRQVIARFDAERQALAMMDHPNIARVFDAGATDTGRPYFVMELVMGVPITEYCDQNKLRITQRLDLFVQVCQAIQHAHQKGLIHRDIKPSNVLISMQDDRPVAKVIDFGIAKATQATLTEKTLFTQFGQWIGTLEYTSPEQAAGSLDVDTRSDIYSLGVLLYELLTGSTPFDPRELRSKAYAEMQRIIREVDPLKPSMRLGTMETLPTVAAHRQLNPQKLGAIIRGELDWIVMKCLEKDRTRRYDSASALASDVVHHLADEPVVAGAPSRMYQFKKFVRRNKGHVVAVGAVVMVLTVGATVSTWQAVRIGAEQQKTLAQKLEADWQRDAAQRQRREAENEARKSGAVTTFLQWMLLTPSDPASAGLNETVSTVLGRAAQSVDDMFQRDPEIRANIHDTLGRTYESLNLFREAETQFRASLRLCQTELGWSHPQTGRATRHLADFLLNAGKSANAEAVLRLYLTEAPKPAGAPDRERGMVQLSLADWLVDAGRAQGAVQLLKETMLFRIDSIVEDLPALGSKPFHATEPLRINRQLLAEATGVYGEGFRSFSKSEGDRSLRTLVAAYLFADCSLLKEDFATAIKVFRSLLPQTEAVLGAEHPFTLYVVRGLTEALDCVGEQSDADRILDALVQQRKALHGAEDPATLSAISLQLARLERLGRYHEAIPSRQNLLAAQRRAYGGFHPQTIASMDALAASFLAVQNSTEAKQLFASARDTAAAQLGPDSKVVKQFDARLADVDARLAILSKPLKIVVIKVSGIAQYRPSEREPWKPVAPGMELAEGGEVRTGVRSMVVLDIGQGRTCEIERLRTVKIDRATLERSKSKFFTPNVMIAIEG
jgi:tetratricopeptide (TPR) repeat protein